MTSTDGFQVYQDLRRFLFCDESLEQMAVAFQPSEPLLSRVAEQLRQGIGARAELEDPAVQLQFGAHPVFWLFLARARQLDGDQAGAQEALRRALRVEEMETRYELQIWTNLRALGVQPSGGERPDQVLGVVIDMGMDRGVATVAGFADGDARIFWSSGGGVIGDLRRFPAVAGAAQNLTGVAGQFLSFLPTGDPHSLPESGWLRLSFLTRAGAHTTEVEEAALQDSGHLLYPVYAAMHSLITQLRLLSESHSKE